MTSALGSTPSIEIQGTVHSGSYFQIVEKNGIDWQLWLDVLQGKVAGAIFREAVNKEVRQQICDNFWQHIASKPKENSLPAHAKAFVGASLSKSIEAYCQQAEQTRQDISGLFDNTGDFFEYLMGNIRESLVQQGFSLRIAEYNGIQAGKCKMRSWANTGDFVLVPHDDFGVLKASHLKNFEVGTIDRVVGHLMCLENGAGGELQYWNISPNDETREALGFEYDSFGYPVDSLAKFDKITLPIKPGDIYLFDVTKVHAVGAKANDEVNRSTIAWSMGFLDPQTVLYWA